MASAGEKQGGEDGPVKATILECRPNFGVRRLWACSAPAKLLGDSKMAAEPVRGQACDLLQRSGFLEQVGGARNMNHDALAKLASPEKELVIGDHGNIFAADDEKRGRANRAEGIRDEIGTAATGNDCGDYAFGVRFANSRLVWAHFALIALKWHSAFRKT